MSNDVLSDTHQDDAADPALLLASTAELTPTEPETSPEPELTGFAAMNLSQEVRDALDDMGYFTPTPVQAAVFTALHAGRDLLVQSKTGTGKTAAFGLPILEALDVTKKQVQALILTPTRELALQVCREIQQLGKYKNVAIEPIYGGAPIGKQIQALRDGVHIVVGTPGRVLDHIGRRTFDTRHVKTFVLDECDEMLSMGFLEDIERVVATLPKDGFQTALFSATMPDEVARYARRHMKEAERIALSLDGISVADIHHAYYIVSGVAKTRDLLKIILAEKPEAAIIFCNTRDETAMIARFLQRQGLDAEHISSDLGQNDRERVMKRMRDHNLKYLVATDVAARGIDITDLSHVINFSFPESPEVYVHRTGRTGRAGKKGIALSLIGPRELGAFYMLKLTYKITPEERDLPPAELLEGVLKTTTKHVGAAIPPDPLDVLVNHVTGEPTAEQIAFAKRVLGHAEAERVISLLVAEKAAAIAAAKKAAADAAAAAREAERGEGGYGRDREERPRFGRDRDDRGPRRDRDDRGPRREGGEDRPRFDREARGDGPRRDRDDRPRRDRDDRPRDDRPREDRPPREARDDRPREDRPREDRPRAEGEGGGRDWREARGDRPRRDRDDRPRREGSSDRPERSASPQGERGVEGLPADGAPAEVRTDERPAGEDRPRERHRRDRDDRGGRDRGGRDRGRDRDDRPRRDAAPAQVAADADAVVASAEAADAEVAAREVVVDVDASTVETAAPAPRRDDDGGRDRGGRGRGRGRGNGAIAAPPPAADGNREFWETWAEEKSTRPPEPAREESAEPARDARPPREDRGPRRERGDRGDRGDRGRRSRDDRPAPATPTASASAARGDDPGSLVRLYVSLGKDHGVAADDVRALLGKSLGDDASRIGSVAMRGNHCYVRVPEDLVARITEAVNGTTHNDTEIKVEPARA